MIPSFIQERAGVPLGLALLASIAGCTAQPTGPLRSTQEVAVAGPRSGVALTAGEVAVHFVPLVSPNAPHGGIGFGVHRERGGSIPLGTARLADDGTDLTVEVAISGLIPHPGEYSDSYTLRLRGHAEAGTTPLDCNGRPHVGTVFSEESSDADGEIQGTFQVVGRSLSEVGALMLLWDEMPLACGPVRGS